ncbi:SAICAR synthase-like protein [Basidiobolus meristosporus CBS 931.73]|uniref:Kinase n=1 Tax=Basidiobolus meristosporus CBS 931.73 TaxID=1314790 RepID=A0A1Y1X0Y2_9FUNG|nr:SAICAR synthase-like protein [Basidiobolus meristosporus CBS 931.73]|eukprot:ORX79433.1 SAICAR synthase-like protein [Basidiobolus meristosporus CBS 931.73]
MSKHGRSAIITTNPTGLCTDNLWRTQTIDTHSSDLPLKTLEATPYEESPELSDDIMYSSSIPLIPYRNQVGGHTPLLRFSRKALCKPLNVHEKNFYEHIEANHPELLPFTAKYIGVININFKTERSGELTPEFIFTKNRHILPDWLVKKLSFCSPGDALLSKSCPGLSKANNELKEQIVKELLSPISKESDQGSSDSERRGEAGKYVMQRRKSTPQVRPTLGRKVSRDSTATSIPVPDTPLTRSHSHKEKFTNPWSVQCYKRFRANSASSEDIKEWMLLEDLVDGIKSPCILDLKMGTRQYGVNATQKKYDSQTLKCAKSTSKSLGVRMCGMQVSRPKVNEVYYQNKYHGRKLNEAGFKSALEAYLFDGERVDTRHIPTIIRKLQSLSKAVKNTDCYRFYASSLLFVYDSAESGEDKEISIKMIDFANSVTNAQTLRKDKSVPYPPTKPGPDGGYLHGLRTLIYSFQEIWQQHASAEDRERHGDSLLSSESDNECDISDAIYSWKVNPAE